MSNSIDDDALEMQRSHSLHGSALAVFTWGIGTFLLSLVTLVDLLTGDNLPGGVLYVVYIVGPILGILGAIATPYKANVKIGLIALTLFLLPVQFFIIGMILIATMGFEGIH